jgi:hypothetical protein
MSVGELIIIVGFCIALGVVLLVEWFEGKAP